MKPKIVFIERKPTSSVSIERVFRQIAKGLTDDFDVEFQQLPFGYGVTAIIKNLIFFRPLKADIYHITGDVHYIAMRLPGPKTVLTIHDLVFLRRRRRFRRWLLKKVFLTLPVARSARITAISNATLDEIGCETPEATRRVTVISDPLVEGFNAGPEKPFNGAKPVILQIGTTPNKNLDSLVSAVCGVPCHLRIIGSIPDETKQLLEADNIEFSTAEGLDEHEIVEEYRNADIVTFCSTYEGFGLPVIEAQAMRKPIITSNIPPMNDVAGDGAVLVDPHDPKAIRTAIEKIRDDELLRQTLIENGIENIKRFDAGSIARAFEAVYRGMLS